MKIKENGRSMVEMLGVLAIIGVLSAGALAGYSKAMFRHRINQTIEEFSLVLQRFAELEQKGIGDGVEIWGADNIIKYGLMPKCQKFNDVEYYGGEFFIIINKDNKNALLREVYYRFQGLAHCISSTKINS